jgi:hypothetical protein
MRANRWITSVSIIAVAALLGWDSAVAQQVTGIPGSPSATTTIEGGQLPPLPQKFGGKIERNAAQSTPYWPMRVVPPKGAPNVLLIMTDDTGFGVTSTFASSRRQRSTASAQMACALPTSTRRRYARHRGQPSSLAAIITRWASVSSPSSQRVIPATTAS